MARGLPGTSAGTGLESTSIGDSRGLYKSGRIQDPRSYPILQLRGESPTIYIMKRYSLGSEYMQEAVPHSTKLCNYL